MRFGDVTMVKILPFQKTGLLISQTDEFLDKLGEAFMVAEKAIVHYLDKGNDGELDERLVQIRKIEERCDELRRSNSSIMYTEMLMPDTRGDILSLGAELDTLLDANVHLLAHLAIERPEIPAEFTDGFESVMAETAQAGQSLLQGARAYFKQPQAVRDHVQRVIFHQSEATTVAIRTGKAIFDSDLPLERKRQLRECMYRLREVASMADDVADQLSIFAVKRSI
jgi:uncharacterized protein Yka (UPF0111/DUF47 family)